MTRSRPRNSFCDGEREHAGDCEEDRTAGDDIRIWRRVLQSAVNDGKTAESAVVGLIDAAKHNLANPDDSEERMEALLTLGTIAHALLHVAKDTSPIGPFAREVERLLTQFIRLVRLQARW
jgi:signal transduction protein with GAF and PtsI domain